MLSDTKGHSFYTHAQFQHVLGQKRSVKGSELLENATQKVYDMD